MLACAMSNANIVGRMRKLLDDHEAGLVSVLQVEKEMENLMQALEGIFQATINKSRKLSYHLVWASMEETEAETREATARALREWRGFLDSLPQ